MINIRLPNITAHTDREKLEQIRSYLYQFAQELNWALSNIDSKASEATEKIAATTQQKNAVEQAQATFSEVKSLIIKSADIVNSYYEQINKKLEGVYVAEASFPGGSAKFIQETTLNLEANATNINILFGNTQIIEESVFGLSSSLDAVADDVTGLSSSVGDLSTAVDGVEEGVGSLHATMGEVAHDVGVMQDAVDNLGDSVESINSNMAAVEGSVAGVRGDLDSLSDDVDSMGENLESINGAVKTGAESTTIVGAEAWVKIGVLEYEDSGFPIYGMEIGQVNTGNGVELYKRFAQYRSDGVHLYDQNGIEVATISDYKLKITNAEMINAVITNSLNLGGYEISTSKGLAFKWKGS